MLRVILKSRVDIEKQVISRFPSSTRVKLKNDNMVYVTPDLIDESILSSNVMMLSHASNDDIAELMRMCGININSNLEDDSYIKLAIVNEGIIASVTVARMAKLEHDGILTYVALMGTRPDCRGCGYANLLFDTLVDLSRSARGGGGAVYIMTQAVNRGDGWALWKNLLTVGPLPMFMLIQLWFFSDTCLEGGVKVVGDMF
eukprot:1338686-Prymnesium_polylepis.1